MEKLVLEGFRAEVPRLLIWTHARTWKPSVARKMLKSSLPKLHRMGSDADPWFSGIHGTEHLPRQRNLFQCVSGGCALH